MRNLCNKANVPYLLAGAFATLTLIASGALVAAPYVGFLSSVAVFNVALPVALSLFALSVLVLAFSYKMISNNKKVDVEKNKFAEKEQELKQQLESKVQELKSKIALGEEAARKKMEELKEQLTDAQQESNRKGQELEAANKQVKELKDQLNELTNEEKRLEADNKNTTDNLQKKIAELEQKIKGLESKVKKLNGEKEQLAEDLRGKAEKIKQLKSDDLSKQVLQNKRNSKGAQAINDAGIITPKEQGIQVGQQQRNTSIQTEVERDSKETQANDEKKSTLEQKVEDLEGNIKKLSERIDQLQCELECSKEYLKYKEAIVYELARDKISVEAKNISITEELKDSEGKVQVLESQVEKSNERGKQLEEHLKESANNEISSSIKVRELESKLEEVYQEKNDGERQVAEIMKQKDKIEGTLTNKMYRSAKKEKELQKETKKRENMEVQVISLEDKVQKETKERETMEARMISLEEQLHEATQRAEVAEKEKGELRNELQESKELEEQQVDEALKSEEELKELQKKSSEYIMEKESKIEDLSFKLTQEIQLRKVAEEQVGLLEKELDRTKQELQCETQERVKSSQRESEFEELRFEIDALKDEQSREDSNEESGDLLLESDDQEVKALGSSAEESSERDKLNNEQSKTELEKVHLQGKLKEVNASEESDGLLRELNQKVKDSGKRLKELQDEYRVSADQRSGLSFTSRPGIEILKGIKKGKNLSVGPDKIIEAKDYLIKQRRNLKSQIDACWESYDCLYKVNNLLTQKIEGSKKESNQKKNRNRTRVQGEGSCSERFSNLQSKAKKFSKEVNELKKDEEDLNWLDTINSSKLLDREGKKVAEIIDNIIKTNGSLEEKITDFNKLYHNLKALNALLKGELEQIKSQRKDNLLGSQISSARDILEIECTTVDSSECSSNVHESTAGKNSSKSNQFIASTPSNQCEKLEKGHFDIDLSPIQHAEISSTCNSISGELDQSAPESHDQKGLKRRTKQKGKTEHLLEKRMYCHKVRKIAM